MQVPDQAVQENATGPAVADLTLSAVLAQVNPFGVDAVFEPNVRSKNWLNYRDRMRFIITYFRIYQRVPQMHEDPYRNAHWRSGRRWLDDELLVRLYQRANDPDPAEGVIGTR